MKNLKLRGKLVISFCIVILVTALPVILSLNRLRIPPAYATVIKDRSTLFYHRPDDYYQISYKYMASSAYTIHTVEEELLDMILNKKEYSKDNPLAYKDCVYLEMLNTY